MSDPVLYIGISSRSPCYLEDGTGYEPSACVTLPKAEADEYFRLMAEFEKWQERLRPMYEEAQKRYWKASEERQEREQLAKLKAKYEP